MRVFRYQGKNIQGNVIQGFYEAEDKAQVAFMIRRKGFHPISIREYKTLMSTTRVISIGALATFFKEFATMLKAGFTVVESISFLEHQIENNMLKEVLVQMTLDLKHGNSLSEALSIHKGALPGFATRLVEIGESTGNLDVIALNLASIFSDIKKRREKIASVLIYPSLLAFMSVFVAIFLVSKVLPIFSQLFDDAQVVLPLCTRMLLKFSENFNIFLTSAIVFFVALYIFRSKYLSTPKGAFIASKIELKLPILRVLTKKGQTSLFCKMLALCLSSGVPLVEAMDIVKDSLNNEILKRQVDKMRWEIQKGRSFAEVIDTTLLPHRLKQLIRSGEETGTLEEKLMTASEIFDGEIRTLQDRLFRLLEPSIIIVMSLLVGFIVMSVTIPIFNIYSFY